MIVVCVVCVWRESGVSLAYGGAMITDMQVSMETKAQKHIYSQILV